MDYVSEKDKMDRINEINEVKELFNIVHQSALKFFEHTEQNLRANEMFYFQLDSIQMNLKWIIHDVFYVTEALLTACYHDGEYINEVKLLHELYNLYQRSEIIANVRKDPDNEHFATREDWFIQQCLEFKRDIVEIRDYIYENELEDVRPFNGFKNVEPDDEDQQDYEQEMYELNRQYEKDAI